MKKNISFLALSFFIHLSFAQTKTNYFVIFKDKKNSPFEISNPSAFLSEKAVARRTKQHIEIKESDLPVNANYIRAVENFGCKIISQSKWYNAISITNLDANKISEIKKLSFVKEIQTIIIPTSSSVPSKFMIENTSLNKPIEKKKSVKVFGLNYGLSFNQANQINIDCMHAMGYQGQGMTIAMLDAGFYKVDSLPAFDSVRMSGRILGCRDFASGIFGDTTVYEDYPHGMNTLSCIVGNLPGRIIGTAPQAKVWLLRTEDAATETMQEEINWLVGAEFADSVGADVINSSLGYNLFDGGIGNHTYADMDGNTTIITKAADWAASVGIFVCSSAGNSAGPPWYKITAPADADSILTVGAVDSTGAVAGFSSRGYTFDGRIKPNVAARGVQAIVAFQLGDVISASGTSFSSPITAGAVACLWQANPSKTNMEVLLAIEQSANQFSNPDSLTGYGIPDFCLASNLLVGIFEKGNCVESINVYPNPFSSSFDIQYYSFKNQTLTIELNDLEGRKVYSASKELTAGITNFIKGVNLEKSAAGLYILKLQTSEKLCYKKIVKK